MFNSALSLSGFSHAALSARRDANARAGRSASPATPGAVRAMPAAAPAPATDRNQHRYFDIIAVWDQGLDALRSQIDLVSNWGPYELAECIPLYDGADGKPRILCRFFYHCASSDRHAASAQAQFKFALVNCLQQIGDWEDVAGQTSPQEERV